MTENEPPAHDTPGHGTPGHGGWRPGQESNPWSPPPSHGSGYSGSGHGYPYQATPPPPHYPSGSSSAIGDFGHGGRGGGKPAKWVAGIALLAALVGGGAGAAGGYLVADNATTSSGSNALNEPLPAKTTGAAPAGSTEAVAQKLIPSVVQLQVRGSNGAGEGSGFVLSEDGFILTNNHVIEGAAGTGGSIKVVFQNGDQTSASVVGRDPTTDIAVVRAQGVTGLPTVELGRSDDLRVGQPVVAIGSPFELQGTVTSGIISSLHRPVTAGGQGDQTTVMDAIQTDAAINPGNSGGPLANMQGQVIGINSAIYSPQTAGVQGHSEAGNVGIGFAIPIDQARRTADDIIKTGHATQTYIGATVGNNPSGGATIGDVLPDSPAAKAGLKAGNVVVKLNDRRIDDANTLVAAIRTRAPGERVTLTLANGQTLQITLGGQPVQTG